MWGDPEIVVLLQDGILSSGASSLLKTMALNRTYKVNWSHPCKLLRRQSRLSAMFKAILPSLERSAEATDDVTALNPFSETTFITFVSCSIFSKRSFNASNGLLWAPRILQPRDSLILIFMLWFVCRKWLEMIFKKSLEQSLWRWPCYLEH